MKENLNKKTTYSLGVLFLIMLVVLLVYEVSRKGIYDSKVGINMVIVGKESIAVAILRPDESILNWVTLPANLKVKIYNSTATYPVSSLWKYGEMEKRPFWEMEKTIGSSMGVVIARTIKIDKEPTVENILGSIHSLSLKTDLSIRDRWLIRQFLSEYVNSKKILEIEPPKNAYDKVVEPDGKEFVAFNSVMNLWTKNKFIYEEVSNENVDVYVINASEVSGMGVNLAKQLESSGLRVVEIKADKTERYSHPGCNFRVYGNFPFTEKMMIDQLGCSRYERQTQDDQEEKIEIWIK